MESGRIFPLLNSVVNYLCKSIFFFIVIHVALRSFNGVMNGTDVVVEYILLLFCFFVFFFINSIG